MVKLVPFLRVCMFFRFLTLFYAFVLFSDEIRGVYSAPRLGMFGVVNQVLGYVYLYEEQLLPKHISGVVVDFGKTGLYYEPELGPNWWSYYFEPISLGDVNGLQMETCSWKQALEVMLK